MEWIPEKNVTDLPPLGNNKLIFDKVWPLNSMLKNDNRFQSEMRLCGVSYRLNNKMKFCGL